MAASAPRKKNRNNRNRNRNSNRARAPRSPKFTYRWDEGQVDLPLDPPAGVFLTMMRISESGEDVRLTLLAEIVDYLPARVRDEMEEKLPTSKFFTCLMEWIDAVSEHVGETVSDELLEEVEAGK